MPGCTNVSYAKHLTLVPRIGVICHNASDVMLRKLVIHEPIGIADPSATSSQRHSKEYQRNRD
jgi:hypothetical protein